MIEWFSAIIVLMFHSTYCRVASSNLFIFELNLIRFELLIQFWDEPWNEAGRFSCEQRKFVTFFHRKSCDPIHTKKLHICLRFTWVAITPVHTELQRILENFPTDCLPRKMWFVPGTEWRTFLMQLCEIINTKQKHCWLCLGNSYCMQLHLQLPFLFNCSHKTLRDVDSRKRSARSFALAHDSLFFLCSLLVINKCAWKLILFAAWKHFI